MSSEDKQIQQLWIEFNQASFGRLCKYECDYTGKDLDSIKNTTLIDDFLGGEASVELLDEKIQQKKAVLSKVRGILPEKMQPEIDDLMQVCEIIRLGGRNELHKYNPSIPNSDNLDDFVEMEADFWGGKISGPDRSVHAIERYLGILHNKSQYGSSFFEVMKTLGLSPREQYIPERTDKHQIPREDVVSLYNDILTDIYDLPAKVIVSDVNNIVTIGETLQIPNSPAYASFTRKRMVELIAHEIEVHMLTYNNHDTFYQHFFVSPAQLIREEGLALFMEKSTYDSIRSIATRAHLEIYMGERLPSDTFREIFFVLGVLLDESYDKTFSRYLRRKRWMPFDHPGVSHKDVAYYQGYAHIENMHSQTDDIRALFSSRVVFDRVQNYDGVILPQFVGQFFVFKQSGSQDFLQYLHEIYADYPGMHTLFEQINIQKLEHLYAKHHHLFAK